MFKYVLLKINITLKNICNKYVLYIMYKLKLYIRTFVFRFYSLCKKKINFVTCHHGGHAYKKSIEFTQVLASYVSFFFLGREFPLAKHFVLRKSMLYMHLKLSSLIYL